MTLEGKITTLDKVQAPVLIEVSNDGVDDLYLVNNITPSKTNKNTMIVRGKRVYGMDIKTDFFKTFPSNEEIKVINEAVLKNIMKSSGNTNFEKRGCTSGTDPEIFVVDDKGNLVPAFTFLGKKTNPLKNRYGETFQEVYADGFAAEMTTKHGTCLGYLCDSVQTGLSMIYKEAQKKNNKFTLSNKSFFEIPLETLQTIDPEHSMLGCAPSLNIYGLETEPLDGTKIPYRSCGGHLHFGVNFFNTKVEDLVKALDAILGVGCVSMFAGYDNPLRREFYGLAGEYRKTNYGFEYRVLSNAWLIHPVLMNIVFDLGRGSFNIAINNLFDNMNYDKDRVIDIIQSCDVKESRKYIKEHKDLFKLCLSVYYSPSAVDFAYRILFNGLDSWVKDSNDIVGNWNLDKEWTYHCDGKEKNVLHSFKSEIMKKAAARKKVK